MAPIFHRYHFDQKRYYRLHPASIRDRIMAQLIDGMILGFICSGLFYMFSDGNLYSVWVSPMVPQYIVEAAAGYSPDPADFWWGGYYGTFTLPYGKTIHLSYPSPLLWLIYIIYYAGLTGVYGQTPGKMAKKLVVLDSAQNRVSGAAAVRRWLGYLVSVLPLGIGLWWKISVAPGQTWHDAISRSQVYMFDRS